MPPRLLSRLTLACLLAAFAAHGLAQSGRPTGIYTCVDAKGRRLTSDRPITECLDREQKELTPSGTVRRTLGPSLTAHERAAKEAAERKAAEDLLRQADERRAQKALVTRYPHQAAHDAERAKALEAVADVVDHGQRRIRFLEEQRAKLLAESEFHKDPARRPLKLKRQIEENEQQIAAQQRFVEAQEAEKKRINSRFDEELARLKVLWAQIAAATASAPAASAAVKP